jgi:pilus assembly protein FimV
MKQVLSLLLALVVMVPDGAFGLGLGKIERKSKINEPFNATIEIIGARADDLADLTVKLADPGRFKNAGLDRPDALAKLHFEVVQNELGSDFIKITSEGPIQESFLNFLIEINWPKGRLFREYTVLLDTPVYEPGVRKRTLAGPARTTVPEMPVRKAVERMAPKPRPSTDTYGPTVRGDTLWEIATQLRSERSVSLHQMLLALWRANPKAFFQDNVNALKKGTVLRIPNTKEVSKLSRAEAIALIQHHHVLWEEYRQRLAGTAGKRAIGTETSRGTAPGETHTVIAGQSNEQLKLLAATEWEVKGQEQGAKDAAASQQIDSIRHELELANEELESKRQEIASLKTNLTEDESLIKDLKQQIDIKNAELAALQTKLAANQQQAQATEGASPPPPPTATRSETPTQDTSAGVSKETAPAASKTGGLPLAEVQPAERAQEPRPVVESQPGREETTADKGILDSIPGGIMTLIAGALAILLGVFALFRGKREETFATPEGEQFTFSLDDLEESDAERPSAERTAVDFDLEGMEAPTAKEAGVGETPIIRPQEWEEDLSPEVDEQLAKFEEEAAPSSKNLDLSSEGFIDIGREDESSKLDERAEFIDLTRAEADLDTVDFQISEPEEKESLGLTSESQDEELPDVFDITKAETTLDESAADVVDLTGGSDFQPSATANVPLMGEISSDEPSGRMAFQPSISLSESPSEAESKMDFVDSDEIEFDIGDMTFEPGHLEEMPGRSESYSTPSDLSWLKDQDAPFVDISKDDTATFPAGGQGKAGADDLDFAFRFSTDLGVSSHGDKQIHDDENDHGAVSPLFHAVEDDTESDENDTKLNLALTYIELGEADGARSILNEVVRVGTEEQKKEAERLLMKL